MFAQDSLVKLATVNPQCSGFPRTPSRRSSHSGDSRKSGRTEDIKRAGTVRPRPSTYDPHPRLGTFCTYVPGLENCVQHTIGNRGVGITLLPVRRGPLLGLL